MEELFKKLRSIINSFDPLGLSPGEVAPEDEYDSETELIIEDVKRIDNFNDLKSKLHETLKKEGVEGTREYEDKLKEATKEIFGMRNEIMRIFDEKWSKGLQEKRTGLRKKAEELERQLRQLDDREKT